MRAVPARMRDRWAHRSELPAGLTAVYWHVLVGTAPAVRAAAADVRHAVSDIDAFHLTPPEWLHMTLFLAGITDTVGAEQLTAALTAATDALRGHPPIAASVAGVRYHPEAITLALEPVPVLRELREQLRTCTTGTFPGEDAPPSDRWVPHVTVAYSTADQPTAPLLDRLGHQVPPRRFTIDTVSLVAQSGPERSWIWRTVGRVRL